MTTPAYSLAAQQIIPGPMGPAGSTYVLVPETMGITLLARLNQDDAYVVQSGVTSIAWTLEDVTMITPSNVNTGTFTAANVVLNSLATGSEWTQDSTGYNFKAPLALAGLSLAANHVYDMQITLTPSSGNPLVWSYIFTAAATY